MTLNLSQLVSKAATFIRNLVTLRKSKVSETGQTKQMDEPRTLLLRITYQWLDIR